MEPAPTWASDATDPMSRVVLPTAKAIAETLPLVTKGHGWQDGLAKPHECLGRLPSSLTQISLVVSRKLQEGTSDRPGRGSEEMLAEPLGMRDS